MALFKCPDCGELVSSKEKCCPHCGRPVNIDPSERTIASEIEVQQQTPQPIPVAPQEMPQPMPPIPQETPPQRMQMPSDPPAKKDGLRIKPWLLILLIAVPVALAIALFVVLWHRDGNSARSAEEAPCEMEWVDLGLSVKWASCNLGAKKPEENGDFYAWGETGTKYKYIEDNYYYFSNPSTLPLSADVANSKLGGSSRMPTKEEFQELLDNCTSVWTTQNGKNGRTFKSKINGNSIFLPAAGIMNEDGHKDESSYGFYWTSTIDPDSPNLAWRLSFGASRAHVRNRDRFYGESIRPVMPAR